MKNLEKWLWCARVLAMAAMVSTLGAQTIPSPSGAPRITLEDAFRRARANSPQLQSAMTGAALAREDRSQAKAVLLPAVDYLNQYIYTEGNGTPSGVFVPNDGVHIYNNQAVVHGDIYSPAKLAGYRMAAAAEAVARAKAEIAERGLVATVVQSYYTLVSAERKGRNAQRSLDEARQFVEITRKQKSGGEAAQADVVKSEIQLQQREREAQDAGLAVEKARVGLAVLLFPDFRQDFSVVDDLEAIPPLAPLEETMAMAAKNNPEIRAAEAAVRQETMGISVARSAMLPSLSFDYFFGISANQFAVYNREHRRNLGSVVQGQLTIPIWSWGAMRSKVRQSELLLEQARTELKFTQRQLLANLHSYYGEAETAEKQVASLRRSAELAGESLRLTLLRYEAGEATVLEVVDAQNTLVQARNALDDGQVRYRLALASLETLTGNF